MNLRSFPLILLLAFALTSVFAGYSFAQTEAELTEAATKTSLLLDQNRYKDAIPYLAKLVKANPNNADIHTSYGVALLFGSKQVDDPAEAKKMSDAALVELQTAKKLGSTNPDLDVAISLLTGKTPTDSDAKSSAADQFMQQAEAFFAQSKYDEALKMYQKALDADPKLYEAALYMGDCYVSKQDWDNAEKSYQKAIAINPDRETAYRYSATPFMKQKKYDVARDRYIEAYITEPYSDMSSGGISQWANVTGAKLGHPKIDIPEIKYDANGKATTVMNENSLTSASKAWVAYSLTRENWHKEKFAKSFPNEKKYRHTLQEETEAIRSVLRKAKEERLAHPHFEILQKLDNEGLLESFILLADSDEGIAQDHPAYLKDNRTKLRQYVLNYVIQK